MIDTNVAMTASGAADHADPAYEAASIRALEALRKDGKIVLDDQWITIGEYQRTIARLSGPSLGHAFLKWVHVNQANPVRCERVRISRTDEPFENYAEFPDDPSLSGCDDDDRKFVAVALSSAGEPSVINSVDTDWWLYRSELRRNGVRIDFLCEHMMRGLAVPDAPPDQR